MANYDDDDSEDSFDETTCWRRCKACTHKVGLWCNDNFEAVLVLQLICILMIIGMIWLILFSVLGEVVGLNSQFFALMILFGIAEAFGQIFQYFHIPSIFGMMTVGFILKNIGYLHIKGGYVIVVTVLRMMTILSILLPAALTLDPEVLKEQPVLIAILAVVPAAVEIGVSCLFSHFTLPLSWLWSLILGFVINAASPAIVIPCLFALERKGYGNINGIHTLVTAAGILDVIFAITLFGLFFGILSAEPGEVLKSLTRGPIEILLAFVYGAGLGHVAQYIPHDDDFYVSELRTMMLGTGSVLSMYGSYSIGFPGAGFLGCFVFAYVANLRWLKLGWKRHNPVREYFKLIWRFFEPISFSLLGSEIDFHQLDFYYMLYGGLGTLVSTLCHFIAAVICCSCFHFKFKERVFIALAWIPKATVQAALGPLPMDITGTHTDIKYYSRIIMSVTVASIFITVPLGIILLLTLGPKLLTKNPVDARRMLAKSTVAQITTPDLVLRSHYRRSSLVMRDMDEPRNHMV